jgi:MerR family transcriptional regulator, light-induced transcriptional regulator
MRDLSPRDLARSLGVSESSVKRWVDDGAVAARRTAGGHRRIALAEAVRFVRLSGAPVVRPDLIVGAGTAAPVARFDAAANQEVAEQLFSLLEQDDAPAARALLLALYVSGWPVAAIGDGPMRIALERIGTLWQHGPAGIVIEHRATDTCVRTLAEMRTLFTPPAPGAPAAVGAAPSGDPYVLPSMMAAAVLADLGFRDHNLGPEAPMAALGQAADHYRPRIVWLAMSVMRDDERLPGDAVELAGRLARRGATLILGGRGAPALAPTAGLLRIHSMAELAAFAHGARPGD